MEMSIRFPHLKLGFDYVPKSFQIFGFEITIYGILIAVGMMLGIAFVVLEAKRSHQDQDKYLNMLMVSLLGAVIGARLLYVGLSWTLYKGNPMEIFNLRSGGYCFYGALLGGVLTAALFCYLCQLNFWQMADTASLGILIGQIIGRWGNFFNRESFGEYTDNLFAMQLPLTGVRSGDVTVLMRENLISENGISYIQVTPVFLYESLWCLLLLLVLLAVRRKKKFQGEVFMRYLAGYGLGRFYFEWLRTDKLLIPGTKIGAGLVISAILFLYFAPAVWVRRTMSRKRAQARKLRREKFYRAEEEAYREADEKEAAQQAEKETALKAEKEAADKENPENSPVGDSVKRVENPDTDADADNWENSEYAHIANNWRKEESRENPKEEKNEAEVPEEESPSLSEASENAENSESGKE